MNGLRPQAAAAAAAWTCGHAVLMLLDRQRLVELARRPVGHDVEVVRVGARADPELGEIALQGGDRRRALAVVRRELLDREEVVRAIGDAGFELAKVLRTQDE